MSTAVVILNWNTRKFLEKFLPDVIRFSGEAEIIVADNASTDDSVDFLKKNFPSVRIIVNNTNEGFTGGYNKALAQIESKYFLLLNSDVSVTSDWLKPLIKLMDENPDIGACQPKILSYATPDHFEYAGAAGGFIDKLGYPFCRGRIFDTIEKDVHQYDDSRQVFWASGACMMVRSDCFRKLNGFDANFFAHMEEIDLCWRMQKAGFKVFFCGNSTVFHVGGGTLHKSNPHKTFLNFRNNLLMIQKNVDYSYLKRTLTARFFLDIIAMTKFIVQGNIADAKAIRKAYKQFNVLKKQYPRTFQEEAVNFNIQHNLIYPSSILFDYYLWGRKKFFDLKWKDVNPFFKK